MKITTFLFFVSTLTRVHCDLYINTAQEFLAFSSKVNLGESTYAGETVHLTDDLDFAGLAFEPAGNYSYDYGFDFSFYGNFNGNGHVIRNLVYQGGSYWVLALIGSAYGDTTIENIVIDKSCIFINSHTMDFSTTAPIVACASSDKSFMYIQSCVNMGTIAYNGPDESPVVGGVAGYVQNAVIVKDCIGAGTVSTNADGFVGGLVGYIVGSSALGYSWIKNSYYDAVTFKGSMYGLISVGKLVDSYLYDNSQKLYTMKGKQTSLTLLTELYSKNSNLNLAVLTLDTGGGDALKPLYAPVVRHMPTPTRSGYTFTGWFTKENGSEPFVIPEGTAITTNVTAYATWKINVYYVHFQMSGEKSIEPMMFEYDNLVTLPKPSGNRVFKNWCMDKECNEYFQSQKYRMPAHNITVFPQWGPVDLDDGLIALIVILVVVLVAAIVTAVVVYARMVYVRKHSVPPGMTVLPDGTITLDSGYFLASKVDLSKSTLVKSKEKFPIEIDGGSLTFGLKHGEFAALDTPLQMKLTLRNRTQEKRAWEILPENLDKYTLLFNPSSGVLSHNDSVKVTAQITMNCTTIVNATVPIVTWQSTKNTITGKSANNSGQQQNENAKSHYMMKLKIESEKSMRLDPDDIKLVQPPVGEGSFGTVFKGFYKSQTVAVKVVKNQANPARMEELYDAEDVMKRFHNTFLVKLVGVVTFPEKMSLVTEFVPYGTYAEVHKREETELIFRARAAYDAVKGLKYLHNAGFIHTALSTNVVYVFSKDIHSSICCKLGNLRSVCASMSDDDDDSNGKDKGNVGTKLAQSLIGAAPELEEGQMKCTFETDVFSFGTVLYEMLSDPTPVGTGSSVSDESGTSFPDEVPDDIVKLIKKCWKKNPSRRPGK